MKRRKTKPLYKIARIYVFSAITGELMDKRFAVVDRIANMPVLPCNETFATIAEACNAFNVWTVAKRKYPYYVLLMTVTKQGTDINKLRELSNGKNV